MLQPTDEELGQWLTRTEDGLVERKTFGDAQDWLKTVVGFANSVAIGRCGVLYIGVRSDGSVQGNNPDLDHVQRKLRQKVDAAYPPIDYTARVLHDGSQKYLCVIVPGSPSRPHFAGPAYVRVGSETVQASKQQFDRLIVERNSKAYKILQFEGKNVRVEHVRSGREAELLGRLVRSDVFQVMGCTEFAATFRDKYTNDQVIALDRLHILEASVERSLMVLEIRDS